MYRNEWNREDAVPGTGSLHLRSSGKTHVSLTYIYLYVLHLLIPALVLTYAFMAMISLCSHTHSHLCFTQMFVQSHSCTNINTQMAEPLHNAHHTSHHRYQQPQCHTGRHTYSHHCILTLSYTQPTDHSLTLMYTFSQTQQALLWLHSHCYTYMRISAKAPTSLHFE